MTQWYYTRGGQQSGPVDSETLRRLIDSGELDKNRDLVWTQGMADWQPPSKVETLASAQTGAPLNPYAPPVSEWNLAEPLPGRAWEEIEPGSQPLELGPCFRRAFELTKRHFGLILLAGLAYFGVSMAVEIPFSMLEAFASHTSTVESSEALPLTLGIAFVHQVVSQLLSLFLSLGLARIGLNLSSGQPATVGMLFGQGSKMLRTIGASILYALMVLGGIVLLVVPGIYLALRFGQYTNAIVDRDLGVIESLKYSSRITQGNRLNLLGIGIVSFLIVIAGLLALIFGLLFTIPLAWILSFVAYRWLQYGRQAIVDPV